MRFITGDGYRSICDYIFDEKGWRLNTNVKNFICTVFVKTDYIDKFIENNLINKDFILITHNSDISITKKYKQYLEYQKLKRWYAQNVDFEHNKLMPIPIGIANPVWPHGDTKILQCVIEQNNIKQKKLYANFNIATNPKIRKHCLKYIDKKYIENNLSYQMYLTNLSKAYFSVCPLGNGIDTHRIWESLYLKTIPIVENTYNINYMIKKYKLPIITIGHWSELQDMELNQTVYKNLIYNFDPRILIVENMIHYE